MARHSTTTTGIKLDNRTRTRLKALSRLKQRSQHWLMLMKEAIELYPEQEQSAEQLKRETLDRWERHEATGEHVSHDAITSWLESWGTEEEGQCPRAGA